MTEYIKVTVQATEPNVINVASSQTTPNLKVTIDPTEQNAKLSRDWAIGEGLIQNEDYSSKTWAAESKSSADLSKMYSEAASLDLNNLENKIIEYDEQLNTTITEGLDSINTSVTGGVSTLETLQANSIAEITTNKESALSDITTAETNVLANIDTSKLNTLAQIEELANSSIEDINATGIDTKVSKSGDTMTGILFFKFDDNFDYSQTTTTQETYSGIVDFTDENGNLCGQISNYINTSNNLVTRIDAIRSVNGEIKRSSIHVFVDANGNAKAQVTTPASSDNSSQIATTAFVKSVLSSSGNGLATFKKNANGYIKFANGIIIQWGSCTSAQNTAKTATFALSFTSTNYKLCLTQNSNNQVDQYANTIYVSKRTATNFTYSSPAKDSVTWHWIAVGY